MIVCPFCKGKLEVLFKTKDLNRKVSQKDFVYLRCPDCKLITISEVLDDLESYYTQEYYRIPSLAKLKRIAKAERFKIEMVKKVISSGALLEVGSAFGVFAYQAKEAGFEVDCIEMDQRCCEYLTGVIGVNAINSSQPHKAVESMRKHNVIVMWHVLEHLPNPRESLEVLANNLLPGGILVAATPNPQAFQFRLLGVQWPHIDAPRHLNLIPEKTLVVYLKKLGLELVFLTTNDKGGRGWNRFSWQRYLMNHCSQKWMQKVAFLAGYLISFPMALWDQRGFNGCAYTAIFRKEAA